MMDAWYAMRGRVRIYTHVEILQIRLRHAFRAVRLASRVDSMGGELSMVSLDAIWRPVLIENEGAQDGPIDAVDHCVIYFL